MYYRTFEQPQFIRHLANTSGAARFPEAHFDMVRIGLGLYGLDASGTMENLQPIGRFHTRISHLHTVPAGTPVGYGAKDSAGQKSRALIEKCGSLVTSGLSIHL